MKREEVAAGVLMFARFAYPPNALGLCGPADSESLLERGSAGQDEFGLRHQAQGFEGAWPYLQLIAAANRIDDPLDAHVVEAYWIGNDLLRRVPIAMMGNSLDARFRRRAGSQWQALTESLEIGARPHHNFHVFSVYPWVGLLNHGTIEEPLRVLDQCRVRWGQVHVALPDRAVVESRGLHWEAGRLLLGHVRTETVLWQDAGRGFVAAPKPGDWVAMHWDWITQVLDSSQLRAIRRETVRNLTIANSHVEGLRPSH